MIRSMTAFGRRTIELGCGRLAWEIRSVNHRFLDLQVRLPDRWRELEPTVRERLKGCVHRGKVEVVLRALAESGGSSVSPPDPARLDALAEAIEAVRQRLPDTRVDALGVLQTLDAGAARSIDDAGQRDTLSRAFVDALGDFVATREREGTAIAMSLAARADEVSATVERVAAGRPEVQARQRKRLLDRLAHLDVMHDGNRLEQEMAVVAQRLDVDEELERLRQHVQELTAVLARDEPVGRRLDFLMQEFNREANTLGAKAADTEAVHAVVDLKVSIEQMREQVQNVE